MNSQPNRPRSPFETSHPSEDNSFFPILKRVALGRDPKGGAASQVDVQKSLRFFALEPAQILALGSPSWLTTAVLPTPQEFDDLLQIQLPDVRMTLQANAKTVVAQLLAAGRLRLRYPEVLARQKARRIYHWVAQAVGALPGQGPIASAIAADLALQLSPAHPDKTARLLVHGAKASGGEGILLAIAHTLAQHEGYQTLNMDCAAYRSEGEAASWDGAKPYWSGSAPGEITSFIHRHSKAIIVFHNLDETLPAVMAALRPALLTGEMVDHHGLEEPSQSIHETLAGAAMNGKKRFQPTTVDCRQAIFLASASHGAEWLIHPDARTLLGESVAQQNANLIQELHHATREHRGDATPLFDATVLRQLAEHHHVIQPPGWAVVQNHARQSLATTLGLARQALGVDVYWADVTTAHALADLLLCHQGAQMGVAHATPQAMFRLLWKPLQAAFFALAQPTPDAGLITVGFDERAVQAWKQIQKQLGQDPMTALRRKNQFVDFCLAFDHNSGNWQVRQVALKAIRRLSDYTGAGGLISHVPETTLADVAGQGPAKAFLAEIVTHLANPQVMARYGVDLPRGVVLHGPPGTGKTLLARALAGQAQMPFISVSGSDMLNPDFITRTYHIAHRAEPCIIHIDEADVLGKRGQQSHAHDVALNAILTKIDGFERHNGIFHVLTTNRPDELDPALTRAGRIDRMFEIGQLDRQGRQACLTTLWPLLDLPEPQRGDIKESILKRTGGMTGAQMAQLHRETALRLVREVVSNPAAALAPQAWVQEEISRIQYGQAQELHAGDDVRRRVAVHEAGHALLHQLLWPLLPIVQLSITPRNGAAGYLAMATEGATKINETPAAIRAYISVLLGGRAAEIVVFGAEGPSSGAGSDLARATTAAWQAVALAGLDNEFGPASLAGLTHGGQLPARVHESAARQAMKWVEQANLDALALLRAHRACLDALVAALLERETLDGHEVTAIVTSLKTVNPAIENASVNPTIDKEPQP